MTIDRRDDPTIDEVRAWLRELRAFLEAAGGAGGDEVTPPDAAAGRQLDLAEGALAGEVEDGAAADTLRGLLAAGVCAAPLPDELAPDRADALVLATLAAAALGPLLLAKRLPVDWYDALGAQTSPVVANAAYKARKAVGERWPRQFVREDRAALIADLAADGARAGLARLVGDLLDGEGSAHVAAYLLERHDRPAGHEWGAIARRLLAFVGTAAIGGVIGNRSDAAVVGLAHPGEATLGGGASGPTPAPAAPVESPKPAMVVVGPSRGAYATIAAALAGVADDGVVLIRPGVYREALALRRPVMLMADGPPGGVVVEAAGRPCLSMATERATAQGLTLRTTRTVINPIVATVDVPKGEIGLENCDIASDSGFGIDVHGAGAAANVSRCSIHSCGVQGVVFREGAGGLVEDCDIWGNNKDGIFITGAGTNPTLRHCRSHDNAWWGLAFASGAGGRAEDCLATGNGRIGIVVEGIGTIATLRRCTARDNSSGIVVLNHASVIAEGCIAIGNRTGNWHVTPDCQVIRR